MGEGTLLHESVVGDLVGEGEREENATKGSFIQSPPKKKKKKPRPPQRGNGVFLGGVGSIELSDKEEKSILVPDKTVLWGRRATLEWVWSEGETGRKKEKL